jgi:hypothetical protein
VGVGDCSILNHKLATGCLKVPPDCRQIALPDKEDAPLENTDKKRLGAGVFKADGKTLVLPNRWPAEQVSEIQNLAANASGVAKELGLLRELRQDAQIAIDALAQGDDMESIKRRLASQALIADTIANRCFEVGLSYSMVPSLHSAAQETLRTGMKAQENSRKALVALAEIKKPRTGATFVKAQQNNLVMVPEATSQPHHIEGGTSGRMDTGETTGSQGESIPIEIVAAQHRAAD